MKYYGKSIVWINKDGSHTYRHIISARVILEAMSRLLFEPSKDNKLEFYSSKNRKVEYK